MPYTFDPIFAVDPGNPANVAANAELVIFTPGDTLMSPLSLTTPDGLPFANPVTTNGSGFAGAFVHESLGRVAWAGGGFTGFFTAYDSLKEEAVAAKDSAAVSAGEAATSAQAAQDAAALVDAPADTTIQGLINTEGSATRAALSATFVGRGDRTSLTVNGGGSELTKVGVVLDRGPAGAFDAAIVESPCVFVDPSNGRLAMIYTGYTRTDAQGVASHGIAYSQDGVTWEKAGQFFTGSGVVGSPDEKGVTAPVTIFHDGVQHLFYVGLTEVGYEAGVKSLCHASRPIGTTTWTRHGAIISPTGTGWTASTIYHPNLVYTKGKWWLFFNAGGEEPDRIERTGYAVSDSINGPWTIDPDPLFPDLTGADYTTYKINAGDPFVWRENGVWRMDFFRGSVTGAGSFDMWATTTDEAFPRGWVIRGKSLQQTPGGFDNEAAAKPWIIERNGRVYHYYTASQTNLGTRIGLAVTGGPLPVKATDKPAPAGFITGSTDSEKIASIIRLLTATSQAEDGVGAILADDFNRQNAGKLGTAPTGQVWGTTAGWTIEDNRAVFRGTVNGYDWINIGVTDFTAEVEISEKVANTTDGTLGFAFGDATTNVRFYMFDSGRGWAGSHSANGSVAAGKMQPTLTGKFRVTKVGDLVSISQGSKRATWNIGTANVPAGTQFSLIGYAAHVPLKINAIKVTSPVIAVDTFNRPDSTVLGTTTDGALNWVDAAGWSIAGNALQYLHTADTRVLVDVLRQDVTVDLEILEVNGNFPIAFTLGTATDYLRFARQSTNTQWYVTRFPEAANVGSALAFPAIVPGKLTIKQAGQVVTITQGANTVSWDFATLGGVEAGTMFGILGSQSSDPLRIDSVTVKP